MKENHKTRKTPAYYRDEIVAKLLERGWQRSGGGLHFPNTTRFAAIGRKTSDFYCYTDSVGVTQKQTFQTQFLAEHPEKIP